MNGKQTRVLIAEDDALVIEALHWMLQKRGYLLIGEAADGRELVALAQSLHPDVILMDVRMPEMDGIEAARQIQETCPTPIVILTAYETQELVERASEYGIGAYLVKPTNAREIERAITIAMRRFADLQELRRLNEELNAYAHTVAHDLKSPLGILIPSALLLADDSFEMSREEIRNQAERLITYAYKLEGIVDSLLLLAEARNVDVVLQQLNMAEIVTGALKRLEWNLQYYRAAITQPAEWPVVMGHPSWVEGVWANYLSNALKYGGASPRIELGGQVESGHMARFWVRDYGPGIPEAVQERLFVPFTRLSDGKVKGHGLGLSIARRIVERLGGEVGVESTPGEGSCFSFTLPLA